MHRLFMSLTIARRLYLLTGLFCAGMTLLARGGVAGGMGFRSRPSRSPALKAMTETVLALIEHERALAAGTDPAEAEVKRRVLALITAMRYGDAGYFTVSDGAGIILAHPSPAVVGRDFSTVADSNGFRFIADVLPRAARDGSAGGCVYVSQAWADGALVQDRGVYGLSSLGLVYPNRRVHGRVGTRVLGPPPGR